MTSGSSPQVLILGYGDEKWHHEGSSKAGGVWSPRRSPSGHPHDCRAGQDRGLLLAVAATGGHCPCIAPL